MPRVDELLKRRWAQGIVLLALVVPLAFLLGPTYRLRSTSIAGKLTVGERAGANIKASRNFDYYPSQKQLELERAEAVEHVLPVFDHHVDQSAVLLARISGAFRAMSQVMTMPNPPLVRPAPKRRGATKEGEEAPKPKPKPKPKPAAPESLRTAFANALQSEVSMETFTTLFKARFSGDMRASVVMLVGSAMDGLVISHTGALEPFRGKPITIRHLVQGRLGRQGEESRANFSGIKDLPQVKEGIRHQADVHGSKLSARTRKAVVDLVEGLVVPNLVFNPAEAARRKELARGRVKSRPLTFVKGQVIVRDGDPLTSEHMRIMAVMEKTQKGVSLFQVLVGVGLFVLLLVLTLYLFASRQFRRFNLAPRDLLMMGMVLVGMIALTRGMLGLVGLGHFGIATYLLPVAAGAMLVRLVVTAEAAAIFAVAAAGVTGLLVDRSLALTLFYLVTGLAGSYGVGKVQSRSTVLRAGLVAGLLGAAAVICINLFNGQIVMRDLILSSMAAVAGGLLSAFVALALLPMLEWAFAYTTDVSLLELANLNHPLLRELMLRAPGTYHHSMVVGNLAETACENIGANGLHARVASYYHDVGKMKNALYFAENFRSDENPHNRLKPSMSALIIRSHVKDGIEMMRDHGLPEPVIETASQHHGTALIGFFYHKALEQKDDEEEVLEEDYRYPGIKPQSREAGVIMVADGVEAAARSLGEPTDDRLKAVVQRIINTQFTDGQLDHCDLTLRDLHLIAKSFLQVLSGIYHARPTYPWQKAGEAGKGRRDETRKGGERNKRETAARTTIPRPHANGRGQEGKTVKDSVDDEQQSRADGPGEGAGSSRDKESEETPPEGSQDIKRLGLN
ncbi:MAG: HDIG domain-containing protein [Deltaproteobacteria bacterium]|nr:HDIG domain-containing protein [Deltaproteobacteria bacterium]